MTDPTRLQRYREAEARYWRRHGVAPEEIFLHLASLGTKVRIQEAGEGPPVLFVHGGPNAGTTWAPLVGGLQEAFRCLVLDRPGCGLSEPVDLSDRDLRAYGSVLLRSVLDGLGLERVAVVGSSLGGALTLFFAAAHPNRVSRMVLEGCPAFLEGMRVPTFMRLLAFGPLGRWIARQEATPERSRDLLRQIGHGKSLDRGGLEDLLEWYLSLMNDTPTMAHEVRLIQQNVRWWGVPKARTYGSRFLKGISPPTLLLWGEADPFGGVDRAQFAAAALPQATLISFPDQGHLPWLDDPATHARAIRTFLSEPATDA